MIISLARALKRASARRRTDFTNRACARARASARGCKRDSSLLGLRSEDDNLKKKRVFLISSFFFANLLKRLFVLAFFTLRRLLVIAARLKLFKKTFFDKLSL